MCTKCPKERCAEKLTLSIQSLHAGGFARIEGLMRKSIIGLGLSDGPTKGTGEVDVSKLEENLSGMLAAQLLQGLKEAEDRTINLAPAGFSFVGSVRPKVLLD